MDLEATTEGIATAEAWIGPATSPTRRRRFRFRLRLGEVVGWVAAAALASWAVRDPYLSGPLKMPDAGPLLGVALVPVAVVMAMALLRRVDRGWRGSATKLTPLGVAWRFVAVIWLGLFVIQEGGLLRDPPYVARPSRQFWWRELDGRLVPFCALMGLVGLVVGLAPAPSRRPGRRRVGWLQPTLMIAFAGAAGLAMLGFYDNGISSLILIAVEGVALAQRPTADLSRPLMPARAVASLLPWSLAAASCVASGAWIFRDLRRGSLATEPVPHRPHRVARVVTLLLTLGSSFWLIRVTLPSFSPPFAEAVPQLFRPREWFVLLSGLAMLAAGLSARAAAPAPPVAPPRRSPVARVVRWAGTILFALILLDILSLAGSAILHRLDPNRDLVDVLFFHWQSHYWSLVWRFDPAMSPSVSDLVAYALNAERWPMLVLLAWLSVGLFSLAFLRDRDRPAALDAVGSDRTTALRFLGGWVSLTAWLLAALLTLGFAGLVFPYLALHAMAF